MKLVYICSPLRGEPEKNIAKANEYAREEAMKGNCAIAPHCLCGSFGLDCAWCSYWRVRLFDTAY